MKVENDIYEEYVSLIEETGVENIAELFEEMGIDYEAEEDLT